MSRMRRKRTPSRASAARQDRLVALHEAAHAVADYRFGFGVERVSIRPTEHTAGHSNSDGEWTDSWSAERAVLVQLAGYAAMMIADERDDERYQHSAATDFDEARRILRWLGDESEFWAHVEDALSFVAGEWRAIEAVASQLLEHETLTGSVDELGFIIDASDGDPDAFAALDVLRHRLALLEAREAGAASSMRRGRKTTASMRRRRTTS